jgi:hypothetical protein
VTGVQTCALPILLGSSEDFDGLVTACEDRAAEIEDQAARQ